MKTLLTLVSALFLAAAPAALAVDEDRAELARALFKALNDKGVKVRSEYDHGMLVAGSSVRLTTTLHAGNRYQLVVGTPYKSSDVDVRLYNKTTGRLVDEDIDEEPIAVVKWTPRETDEYEVVITMASCRGEQAAWVLQTGFFEAD